MERKILHNWWLVVSFTMISVITIAQDHIQFRSYTINDGLSQSSVSTIIQDELGALWLGTQNGINRFKSGKFEVFSSEKNENISNDFVNTSFRDRKNNLWFGTYNGLVSYNLYQMRFQSYQLGENERIEIHSITEDTDGMLWLGCSMGRIYRFNPETEELKLIPNTPFKYTIIGAQSNGDELIFLSQYEGIIITDKSFKEQKIISPQIEDMVFNKLVKSPRYDIVVATNIGLFHVNDQKSNFLPNTNLSAHLIGLNIVDAIYLSKDRLFAASESRGMYQVVKENDSVTVYNYRADILQKGTLASNKLNGLFRGYQGVIWISSDMGLNSFNPDYVGFKGVGVSFDLTLGLPSQNVWGFTESEDGNILYIAGDHGVSSYDKAQHKYYHYFRENIEKGDNITLSLQIVGKNRLLVGCYDGLFELQIDDENKEEYLFTKLGEKSDVNQIPFDVIYSILPFSTPNKYLLGTKGGVSLFDYSTKKFQHLFYSADRENTIGPGACRLIFKNNDAFFTSPDSGGFYRIEEQNGELIASKNTVFSDLNHISKEYFTSAYRQNKDVFWFGTMGDGAIRFDISTKKMHHFTIKEGLPNSVVYNVNGIGENPEYIWFSTNKGVAALNLKTEQFIVFTEKDGLMSNEMNLGASFVSKNKEIYFGGINGYNYIQPEKISKSNKNINVYFSSLVIDNKEVLPEENGILLKGIAFTQKIRLPYQKRSFKLEFFADELDKPEQVEYKYLMMGKDNIEEELGGINELRFTSLAPGTYEINVYARLTNGQWSNNPAHLIIEVERPFWLQWWFYTSFFIILSLYTLFRVRRSIDTERRRQVRLEMKIAERTRELRKKNEQIQEQKQRLVEQTAELEREKEKSERLLNNVLPKGTASQLIKEGRSSARAFKKVTIMFTDFVGFSKIAEKMPAQELVSILDTHFRKFDAIIDKNNLEKIKTIGDAYMCVGGVPIRNKTNPINTTVAAVQIKDYMAKHKAEQLAKGGEYWELRIGINTGPVSAGIIGTKRYAYDVWGNAVNRAQRMERLSAPGKIMVTQDTFDYIEPYFITKKIGLVEMKSGVKVMMYEVISIKPELSMDGLGVEPNDAFQKLVNLHHYSKINYIKAERFIFSKLQKELNPSLYYHSYKHSMDVTRQAERIAIGEGITDEDLFLLKSAASFHDAGFVEHYDHNEEIGARMAEEILPKFGYTEEHIKRIKELIYVTSVPHNPKNLLEEIICDADLDYLGRDDFEVISDKLRRELRDFGKINSDRKWDEKQVKFFEMHKYFTQTSKNTRDDKKRQNLEKIIQRLKENKYAD